MRNKIFDKWYWVFIGLFLLSVSAVYVVFGENSHIAVHDNLDLFVAQFRMLKNTDSFFSHGVDVPFLGGVTRDNLPSELSLYTLLYFLFPSFAAYIIGYLIKVVTAVVSVCLLAKEWYGAEWVQYRPLAALMGLVYGILNVFPAFGIPFASIPFALYLLLRIYRKPSAGPYILLFCYPFVSYFSYFGFFILAYLFAGMIWIGIRDKKMPVSLAGALCVLALGYVCFEYRLFYTMLFGGVETIRSTMVEADLTAGEILAQGADVWMHGVFHAQSDHEKLVLWICMAYFIWLNGKYIAGKKIKSMFSDIYNLLMFVLAFNSMIYGVYNWGAFRRLVETLLPPLKGFQFNRTIFFNPFLWYGAFFIVLQRVYSYVLKMEKGKMRFLLGRAVYGLLLLAMAVVLFTPSRYNDLYFTCKNKALELLKGKETDEMNYREFYSEDLFAWIKEDIGYQGEWSAAYGFHPAVLEYNGICTLDGYLGFYPQQYKEDFRKIIAPALERVEASRLYYDNWGARAYLYPGTDLSAVSSSKSFTVTDRDLYVDARAFEDLGGVYIFSRFEFGNAQEAGFYLVKAYGREGAPYAVYVYRRQDSAA